MPDVWERNWSARPLRAYLLGTLDWDTLLAVQRRLVFEVSGDAALATVIVCEHPPSITMGRLASRVHVRPSPEQLAERDWPLHWLPRGGGCWLHVPGQVACYVILPLAEYGLLPATFVTTLTLALQDVVQRFCPESTIDRATPGIRVRGRRLAAIGTAIRSTAHTQVSAFGAILNVNPDLDHFDVCDCDGDAKPMTSLQRESQLRARMPTVRQLLLEAIEQRFQITRVSVHHHHPAFEETARRYASTARRHKI